MKGKAPLKEIERVCRSLHTHELATRDEINELLTLQRWRSVDEFLEFLSKQNLLDKTATTPDGGTIRDGWRLAFKADAMGWTYFELDNSPKIPFEILERMPASLVRSTESVPVDRIQTTLQVATTNPENQSLRNSIQAATGGPVELVLSTAAGIRKIIDLYYSTEVETSRHNADAAKENHTIQIGDSEEDVSQSTPVGRMLSVIIEGALAAGEADIHIEPYADRVQVRYGSGMRLREANRLEKDLSQKLARLIKSKAELSSAEFLNQDGKIVHTYNGKSYDLRVAVLPSAWGESITMRMGQEEARSLEEVGMSPATYERWTEELENNNGLFLATGPMGSGKSTLNYATAKHFAGPSRKIVSLEAPIEYRFDEWLTQVPVDHSRGMSWNDIMPTVLRSAAATIMLGEINHRDIAHTAVEAANTGHQVFSTLHTNDATGTIIRLREYGIQTSVLADVCRAICAQRIPWLLCPECKIIETPRQKLVDGFGIDNETLANGKWYSAGQGGCENCNFTGLKGRRPIHELMTFGGNVREAILDDRPRKEITIAAQAEGMQTLREEGLLLAMSGATSLSEIRKHIILD